MRDEATGDQHAQDLGRWRAWDEFLESQTDPGFRQSSWYAAFKATYNGWSHDGTVLRGGEAVVGGAVVFRRSFAPERCYYYMPDGPVLSERDTEAEQEQVFRAVMASIDRRRRSEREAVSHLCISPRWVRVPGFVKEFREARHYYGLPRDTQIVDLEPPEDAILAQMKPKGRYNIGLARRLGVSVVEDVSPQGIDDFLRLYGETFARKDMEGHSPDYFRTLVPMLSSSGHGSVFFAEYGGIRLATALVVYFGGTATYYYGGSCSTHRNVMAPYLLHFEAMCRAKARGCRRYDLFGVTPKGELGDGWTDISVFKRKFGGREVRLVPTLEYVYDATAYREWEETERDRRRARRSRHGESHLLAGTG